MGAIGMGALWGGVAVLLTFLRVWGFISGEWQFVAGIVPLVVLWYYE